MRTLWVLLVWILVVAVAPEAFADGVKVRAPKKYTLALGDSLTFGFQRATFLTDPFDLSAFETGWAFRFVTRLQKTDVGDDSRLVNLGCPGETTESFLAGPCLYQVAGFPLHVAYDGAQLAAAKAFIVARRGRVNPILISLGANDALALVNGCATQERPLNLPCIAAGFPDLVAAVVTNYDQALARLRRAARKADIIVLLPYNPLAILEPASDFLALQLNSQIAVVAARHRARVADGLAAFQAFPGLHPLTLCTLTGMCIAPPFGPDIHPSDLGYQVLAEEIWAASGYERFEGDDDEDDDHDGRHGRNEEDD